MNILILIPCFNDNNYLPDLIRRIRLYSNLPILVIDDASENSVMLNASKIQVITNVSNLGKGGTLKKGFAYAHKNKFSHIITIDADLQHSPEKIDAFINFDENCDLVCGERVVDKSMPIHRRLSNKLSSWIISILCGQTVSDSQCGYRRYSVDAVINTECIENGFQFESEILIKLLKKNKRLGNIQIPTVYGNEVSSIHNVRDTFKFIKLIIGNL